MLFSAKGKLSEMSASNFPIVNVLWTDLVAHFRLCWKQIFTDILLPSLYTLYTHLSLPIYALLIAHIVISFWCNKTLWRSWFKIRWINLLNLRGNQIGFICISLIFHCLYIGKQIQNQQLCNRPQGLTEIVGIALYWLPFNKLKCPCRIAGHCRKYS